MIEGYIETHPVFTRQELMDSCGDTQNNANLLYRAKRAGKVISIARGVYASNTGRYRANEASPYAVAEKLGTDVVFAYNSALSLLVGTHDVTSRVVFYANSTERRIKWGGHEYVGYPKPDGVSTKERRLPDGTSVRFTDKEQTILDCLTRPDRCGGSEALLRSLSAIEFVDAARLANEAMNHSKSLAAKLGWLLDAKKGEWSVSESVLERLREEISGRGPFYFTRSHDVVADSWYGKWRLYLPASVAECERWLEG